MLALVAWADDIVVTTFRVAGPYEVRQPVLLDSVNLNAETYKASALIDTPLKLDLARHATEITDSLLPACPYEQALCLLQTDVQVLGYAKAKFEIRHLKDYQLFVDGKKASGEQDLLAGNHEIVVKYLAKAASRDTAVLVIKPTGEGQIQALNPNGAKRLYTLSDVTDGTRIQSASLSPDGRYLISRYVETQPGGNSSWRYELTEPRTGKQLLTTDKNISWMPRSNRYYYTEREGTGRRIIVVDPATNEQQTLATGLSNDGFRMMPDERHLLMTHEEEAVKRPEGVYEITEPDDRQPGWRRRSTLSLYDTQTGLSQQLTFGFHNVGVSDVSADGRYLLLMGSRSRLTQRPTTLFSLVRLDLNTMKADTLVSDDGFLNDAIFSPDGHQLLVTGSPESFGGIGKNVPEGRIPSMTDLQLYLFDIASHKVTPLTKTFNPCVHAAQWSKADGQIYFSAEDRDCMNLFRLNPKTQKIDRIELPEEIISNFSLARTSPLMAFTGQGASNANRSYLLDLKEMKKARQTKKLPISSGVNVVNMKYTLLDDPNKELLKDIELGDCQPWDFVSSKGDTICGRYYLPPHFDASKRYPMIVNYYGGCSPTSRNFETRYPQHAYAALGYVVYVINPSGATGFGQEFSSRHVNTAGKGVAEDIIEGVKRFCAEHSFVDEKKIGCIGASYGGFMTQYLQTQTDIFAAAISHAGISDHTSYWGEGYWGYSYSEVSMAESYPWTRRDLYVDQSPLFNADKIHTPLLFLHGAADTNVPVGESIQMFNALKLLGRPTAFVVVEGENHWIMDYQKRKKWQNTIFAWFQKWLKDDSSWWDFMYKPLPK
ncbi:MAG: prolyl oligopeptidase family serine peptidase [Prevotella sp.]|nr:prolyl oligopeptidase family serine peptidase [Prevotella sp.]